MNVPMRWRVRVRVPATTANLGSGFDSLGLALDLWNEFEAVVKPVTDGGDIDVVTNGLRVGRSECHGEGAGELDLGEKGLLHRAVLSGLRDDSRFNVFHSPGDPAYEGTDVNSPSASSASAEIDYEAFNTVPLSGGLGSSATAVVAGLLIANEMRHDKLSVKQLIRRATDLEGHPDNVAAAILGGFCVSVTTDDGDVHTLSLPPLNDMTVIVAVPDFYLGTRDSRDILPERVPLKDAVYNLSRAAFWVAAVAQGRTDALAVATGDALHQPYRRDRIPGIEDVFEEARRAGAAGVALSGAGPSVVAFLSDEADGDNVTAAVEEGMRRAFQKVGVTARFFHLRPSAQGAHVVH